VRWKWMIWRLMAHKGSNDEPKEESMISARMYVLMKSSEGESW
jgi:hypothetical protein